MITTIDENYCDVEHHEKDDMETTLLNYSQNHFLQTSHTPFCQPPLLQEFPMDGNSSNYDAVFNGTYITPPDTDIHKRLLLKQMRGPTTSHMMPNYFSTTDYASGWKRLKNKHPHA